MALFKPYHGSSANLNTTTTPLVEGHGYFCTDNGALAYDLKVNDVLQRIQVRGSSNHTATLLSSGWSAGGTQTISWSEIKASSNGRVDLAMSATSEQKAAAKNADIAVTAQTDGSITVTANGTAPAVDLPVIITLY